MLQSKLLAFKAAVTWARSAWVPPSKTYLPPAACAAGREGEREEQRKEKALAACPLDLSSSRLPRASHGSGELLSLATIAIGLTPKNELGRKTT